MIYILYDKPEKSEDMSFLSSKIREDYKEIYPDYRCNSIKKTFLFALSSFHEYKEHDIILCWYDFMGVITWWLSKILHKNVTVIAINLLLKDKNTLKNKIAKKMYKIALKNKHFYATVTTREYGKRLNSMLKINKKYYLLNDVYHTWYDMKNVYEEKKYVFCGGRNARDWKLMIDLAHQLSNITFYFVMDPEELNLYQSSLSNNVIVKSNLSLIEFMKALCESTIVALPLNTWAPAGLIVLFEAVANNRLVLTTDTVSTHEYLSDATDLLCNTKEEWIDKIKYYIDNSNERKVKTEMLKKGIEQRYSDEVYAQTISRIIEEVREDEVNG